MDITSFVIKFLKRIRYKVLFGSLVIGLLVSYFTQFLQRDYTVHTSIYTGIASSSGLEDDRVGFQEIRLKSTFDNLINLTKSRTSMEKVSTELIALGLIYGNPDEDNMYIQARSYKNLVQHAPQEMLNLVDKNSLENTITGLTNYYKPRIGNFLFEIFASTNPHYSIQALSKVIVRRVSNSEIMEIIYTSSDPGIALNTVKLVSRELTVTHENIRYKDVNNVVKYYEEQLVLRQKALDSLEARLTEYNVDNRVINYLEQTKALAVSFTNFEDRVEQVSRDYESASRLVEELERRSDKNTKLMRSNSKFVTLLDSLSFVNGKITEMEIFLVDNSYSAEALNRNDRLNRYRQQLKHLEKEISNIADEINISKYSREGVSMSTMTDKWLEEIIKKEKAGKELEVLMDRKKEFDDQYRIYSPVGAQLNRREREIRITESSYLEILHGLNMAKLKQKNIQLTSSSLSTVSEPVFPTRDNGSKKLLLIIASLVFSALFIIGYYIVREILDLALRDAEKAKRVTGCDILCAFPGSEPTLHRGYVKSSRRKASLYICNYINTLAKSDKPIFINLISTEPKEGKTLMAKHLLEEWENWQYSVNYLRAGSDFKPIGREYITAESYNDLVKGIEQSDTLITLIEFPSMQDATLPQALLRKSDLNIVVIDAKRRWRTSDQILLNELVRVRKEETVVCLTNTSRVATKDFINILPPQTQKRPQF